MMIIIIYCIVCVCIHYVHAPAECAFSRRAPSTTLNHLYPCIIPARPRDVLGINNAFFVPVSGRSNAEIDSFRSSRNTNVNGLDRVSPKITVRSNAAHK